MIAPCYTSIISSISSNSGRFDDTQEYHTVSHIISYNTVSEYYEYYTYTVCCTLDTTVVLTTNTAILLKSSVSLFW